MSRTRRLLVAASGAALVVGVGGAAFAGPAGASGTAAPAPAVAGLGEVATNRLVDHGAAPDASRTIALSLAGRDAAGLDAFLAGEHAALSPAQYLASYGTPQSSVETVTAWAAARNLHVDGVSANRQIVTLTGSQSSLGSALGTHFDTFSDATLARTWVGSVGTASLPASVAAVTTAVTGLSDLDAAHHPLASPSATLALGKSFGPKDFAKIYDAPASATGQGQTAAVIAEGDLTTVRSDLVTFEKNNGLPQVPVTVIGAGSADTSGADEYDLDTQYSTGFAPDVSALRIYDGASLEDTDLAATVASWVNDTAAPQASLSVGECDVLAKVSGFSDTLDATLKQADAEGKSLFVSSGDNGSFCSAFAGVNGVPAGVPDTEYPASSPFVVGVGGTTIVTTAPTQEIAWYAGGGGVSPVEPTATFQAGAGGSYVGLRRGVPDVSLDADPNSGYTVVVAGQNETIGGTSASAPAWQGIWLRAQSAHSGKLGFAGPVIYREPASSFHDITLGANGLYPTTPGYDYATGRGTADIAKFVAAAR